MKQCVATGIPAIGLLILMVVFVIFPIIGACNPHHPLTVFEEIEFWMMTICIFNIPMGFWFPLAFVSYGLGFWLFRQRMKDKSGAVRFIFPEAMMCVPLCLCALLIILGEYRGP